MLIPIIYPDGRHDLVKNHLLTGLIDRKEITCFKRSDGWVDIKKGPLRKTRRQFYSGRERRGMERFMDELKDVFPF